MTDSGPASAIREAFEEGFAASKLNGPIRDAWQRSEAREAAASFALPPAPGEARPSEIDTLKARCSRLEDAAFHFQTCRTCRTDGEDACPSGKRFAAYLRGEDDAEPMDSEADPSSLEHADLAGALPGVRSGHDQQPAVAHSDARVRPDTDGHGRQPVGEARPSAPPAEERDPIVMAADAMREMCAQAIERAMRVKGAMPPDASECATIVRNFTIPDVPVGARMPDGRKYPAIGATKAVAPVSPPGPLKALRGLRDAIRARHHGRMPAEIEQAMADADAVLARQSEEG